MHHLLPLALLSSIAAFAQTTYTLSPSRAVPGNSYVVTVSQDAKCTEPSGTLGSATLSAPLSGLSIRPVADSGNATCKGAWILNVGADTPIGHTALILSTVDSAGKTTKFLDSLDFDVSAVVPGPIPPGIKPQIDVMWKVLPWKAVADSFGRKVADQYFAFNMMVGNNTGYAVQFTSPGFITKAMREYVNSLGEKGVAPLPNDPYNFARSTIEKDQQVGNRAIILNSLLALSGIASSSSGFFHQRGAQANFNLLTGLSNPVETGLGLVWPDRTVRHLIAMDTRGFRDGTIVPNNVPTTLTAFISREVVECNDKSCATDVAHRGIKRVPRQAKFDPNQIMEALGDLVLVGQPIDYLPRVSVTGNKVQFAAVPPVVSSSSAVSMEQGSRNNTITLTGNGFQNATVAPDPDAGITFAAAPVLDADGKSIRLSLSVSENAPVGKSLLTISNVSGSTTVPVSVKAGKPVFTLDPAAKSQADIVNSSISLTAKGTLLTGASFHLGTATLTTKEGPAADEVHLTLPIPAASEPTTLEIVAVRNGQKSDPVKFELQPSPPVLETGAGVPSGVKGAQTAKSVALRGKFLKGVHSITPENGSGLVVSDLAWAAVEGAAQPEILTFKVSTANAVINPTGAASKDWKLILHNGSTSTTALFTVTAK